MARKSVSALNWPEISPTHPPAPCLSWWWWNSTGWLPAISLQYVGCDTEFQLQSIAKSAIKCGRRGRYAPIGQSALWHLHTIAVGVLDNVFGAGIGRILIHRDRRCGRRRSNAARHWNAARANVHHRLHHNTESKSGGRFINQWQWSILWPRTQSDNE